MTHNELNVKRSIGLGRVPRKYPFGQSLNQAEVGATGKSVDKASAAAMATAGKMAMPGGTIKARMVNSEMTNSKGKGSAGSPVRHRTKIPVKNMIFCHFALDFQGFSPPMFSEIKRKFSKLESLNFQNSFSADSAN